ncbi:hypothetical protein PSI15_15015 [Xenorhabdus sp. PR6a]|nr:hypothetical protein [Xenorhabdus sp. PR6a]
MKVKMKCFFDYLVHNHTSVLALFGAFFSGIGIVIHFIYKSLTLFSNRRISKNKYYINEYANIIGDENKKYIEDIITAEVMFKVTKIRSPKLRNIISKLDRNGVRTDYIRDIKKLNPIFRTTFRNKMIHRIVPIFSAIHVDIPAFPSPFDALETRTY